jgi:hypothetical protein
MLNHVEEEAFVPWHAFTKVHMYESVGIVAIPKRPAQATGPHAQVVVMRRRGLLQRGQIVSISNVLLAATTRLAHSTQPIPRRPIEVGQPAHARRRVAVEVNQLARLVVAAPQPGGAAAPATL